MRKALLENENVGKIAEDPKKNAFLKAIEDRDDDYEDFDFLDRPAEDSFRVDVETQPQVEDSQPQQQQSLANGGGEEEANYDSGARNPLQETTTANTANMRPPQSKRRTQAPSRKPTTLAEIRDSVSFLVEEPGSYNTNNGSGALSSDENDDDENASHVSESQYSNKGNPRRTSSNPIIDRLTLKRQSSSSLSTATNAGEGTGGTMAFHAPSTTNTFVPSLLRRATTSSLNSGNSGESAAATERAAGGGEKSFAGRRKGGKSCSVNFSVRDLQKKGVIDGVERRRHQRREKMARERGVLGGVGGLARMSTWDG